jgi:3-phenylpropionate/trans-cinnamate dioxygenase ferredoxin reductase subunit
MTFTFRSVARKSFMIRPGQHFRFEVDVDGVTHSRCYSVSSSAAVPQSFSVTVKRVQNGLVSNWFHANVARGSRIVAAGPQGDFALPDAGVGGYLLLSGGSGITPLMSVLRSLSDANEYPDIVFMHAARSPRDIVFRSELEHRARTTPNLRVLFLPERLGDEPWYTGTLGRLSLELLQANVPSLPGRAVMCCGPAPFMAAARSLCQQAGIPGYRYCEESFGAPPAPLELRASPTAVPVSTACFSVRFNKQDKTIHMAADQCVLAAARAAAIGLPSSCGTGLCGTCKSKLISGQVDMQHTGGIRQREIDNGFFLPCCSKPLSDLVIDR